MKRIGIFTSGREDWNVQRLKEEAEKNGIACTTFPLSELVAGLGERPRASCQGQDLENFDALIVRWTPRGSAEQIIFRMDALHRLENLGVRILNPPGAIEKCADKFYTCSLLEDAGIPVPRTVITERYRDAMNAFLKLQDVIVKPLFGSLGAGMLRVNDRDLAYRLFTTLEFGKNVYYIQEYIPHLNQDLRAFVLNGEVIASMKRIGESWKTNVARGARVQAHELSAELKEVSVRAAKILGCEYAGVDLIECGDKFYVTEVNSIPGWKGLQSVTEINIAERILSYLMGSLT